jgi:cysteinyl-tRNA synthetase
MDDDFNVPEALSVLFDLAKKINKSKQRGDLEKAKVLTKEIINLSNSLGLLEQDPEIFLKSGVDMNESEVQVLIDEREKARDGGNYSKADEIRDQLLEKNIILEDSREGTFWRRR